MKSRSVLMALGLILVLFSYSFAQVPQMINYQGKLTKTSGAPLDTSISMVFSIYADSSGSVLKWTETQGSVKVEKGIFNVLLGSASPIPDTVFEGSIRYLGVKVGADPEITPRKAMVSVPYAYRSGSGGSGGDVGWADDGNVVRLTTSTDSVGLGTTSPTEKLDVVGAVKMTGFKMPTGASNGYILTSDALGMGTWQAAPSGGGDLDWTFRITDTADTTLISKGPWGLARYGNILYGNADSTHVNLGVACTTGTSGQIHKYITVGGGFGNNASRSHATVAGGFSNTADYDNATVGGGYDNTASSWATTVGGGESNIAGNLRATVGGGYNNRASAEYTTVGGGDSDTASGYYATVPGGRANKASAWYSFAAGRRAKAIHAGTFVWADSSDEDFASTGVEQFLIRASGGVGIGTNAPAQQLDVNGTAQMTGFKMTTSPANGYVLTSDASGVGTWQANAGNLYWTFRITDTSDTTLISQGPWGLARYGNVLYGNADSTHVNLGVACTTGASGQNTKYNTVGGGAGNHASGTYATVAGGKSNIANSTYATVGGGENNKADYASTVGGGRYNYAWDVSGEFVGGYATVGGGYADSAIGRFSTVGGGVSNVADSEYCTVGGGEANRALSRASTVAGGGYNKAGWASPYAEGGSTVGGGLYNWALGDKGTVGGGAGNRASGTYATVGGGSANEASGLGATVGGGYYNIASYDYATVGGGYFDTASGQNSTIPGGYGNKTSGNYSFAAGIRAKAIHNSSFVWNDSAGADFASTGNKQFLIHASGGVGINKNNPAQALDVNGTAQMTGFKLTTSPAAGRVLTSDASGVGSWQASAMGGSGTTNYLPKFTASTTLGNSVMYETGGEIGISTTNPEYKLDVRGNRIQLKEDATGDWIALRTDGSVLDFQWQGAHLYMQSATNGEHIFLNPSNSNSYVGIGTNSPAYKLDVNGDINVSGSYNIKKGGTNYTHPDYVFEPDYKLMPLDELRKYVSEKKSLPGVITAEEVKKNEGFKMDQLLVQMLEKIEEQSLYILQLEERLTELEKKGQQR